MLDSSGIVRPSKGCFVRRSVSFLAGLALFAAPLSAVAQTAPSASPAPGGWHGGAHRGMGMPPGAATFALRGAYDAIGHAESAGGSGSYLDAARAHYREALARNAKADTRGSMAEARAASSLARASVALIPPPVPHDVPAPPSPAPGGMRDAGEMRPEGPPPMMGEGPPMGGERGGPGGRGGQGGMRHREGGDGVADLAHLATLANTDEAKHLANDALSANLASQRAAFAGNREEAMRQSRLSHDLADAVRALASLNMKPRTQTPATLKSGQAGR